MNGFDMPQMTPSLLSFLAIGGVVGPHGGKMKNWNCCRHCNFGDKNNRCHFPAEYVHRET